MRVICPYCIKDAELVTGKEVYPHREDLHKKFFWMCKPCKAYVGAHANSSRHAPLGRLADDKLRKAKSAVHASLGILWKHGGRTRNQVYKDLSHLMGVATEDCHVGKFSLGQCNQALKILNDKESWL